jgi:hypothetical protein
MLVAVFTCLRDGLSEPAQGVEVASKRVVEEILMIETHGNFPYKDIRSDRSS